MTIGSENGAPAAFLANAFAVIPSPMLVTDARAPDNPIVWANDAFLALTGYAYDEIMGRNCRLLQGPDTDPMAVARLRTAVAAGQPVSTELLNYRKDGTPFWNTMTVTPVHDDQGLAYYLGAPTVASEARVDGKVGEELERRISARTSDLRLALERKTALIQEIDHRVKNTYQVISSLMLLKARRTPEGEARIALEGMAERIGALATAHRLVHAEGEQFDLRDFVAELVADVSAGLPDERVRIQAEADAMSLPAAMAVPLALMIHELMANAVRHAFPEGRQGSVAIAARRADEGLRLAVRDDGIGLGPAAEQVGFGRTLVDMVVRQLRGRIRWAEAERGTLIEVDMPIPAGR